MFRAVCLCLLVVFCAPAGANPSKSRSGAPVARRDPMKVLGFTSAGYKNSDHLVQLTRERNEFLGEGCYGRVFAITDVSGQQPLPYVLKLSRSGEPGPMELLDDPFPGRNLGQTVASLGASQILRRLPGRHAGVSHAEMARAPTDGGRMMDAFPDGLAQYRAVLKRVADMPQAAYDEFAQTLLYMHRHGYCFDYCQGRNVLVDDAGQRFYPVDLHKSSSPVALNKMIAPLMDTQYGYRLLKQTWPSVRLKKYFATILEKGLATMRLPERLALPAVGPLEIPYVEHARMEYLFWLAGRAGEWAQVRAELSR